MKTKDVDIEAIVKNAETDEIYYTYYKLYETHEMSLNPINKL